MATERTGQNMLHSIYSLVFLYFECLSKLHKGDETFLHSLLSILTWGYNRKEKEECERWTNRKQEGKRGEDFEHYRVLLFSIAYRMTGSASDAEDLVQETYLRYQASVSQEIISLKAYLSTIITRLALDYLKSACVAREEYLGVWLPEPIHTTDDGEFLTAVEQKEALSLAFLRLLEALSPPERAVFLLHEVFDYPFSDIGVILEKSPTNCRQIFHRARQALQDKRTRFEPQRQQQLLQSFLAASQAGNMTALTSLLAQDVVSWSDGGGKVPATSSLSMVSKRWRVSGLSG